MPKAKTKVKDKKWLEFEQKVARLLDLRGYVNIKHNINIKGNQVDVYAEWPTPNRNLPCIVECKHWNKSVGAPIVRDFKTLMDVVGNVDHGYIISEKGFTQNAKAIAAENPQIILSPVNDLIKELINFDHYIDWLIANYEDDELSGYYVDVAASRQVREMGEVYDPFDDYIHQWLEEPGKNHISILGEYGTGKTSFCHKLAHDLALKYKADSAHSRIPILINLRDYAKAMNIRQLLTDLLVNEHNLKNADYPTFSKMNEAGLFLLIFDGFDEMAQKVDPNITVQNFNELAQAVTPNSKVLLTCRTEYFRTKKHEQETLDPKAYIDLSKRPNFDIFYLKDFDDEKIKLFLKKRHPKDWQKYHQQIKDTYNLLELAHRPVLLDIIVQSLPQLIAKKEPINVGKLYEVYTDFWLERDVKLGKTFIPKKRKAQLMLGLAQQMYEADKLHISYTEIPELVKKYFPELKGREARELQYHSHDVLTCSYLHRQDAEGNYKFSHKSFMEYFMAKILNQNIEQDNRKLFALKPLTKEICIFLVSLLNNNQRLSNWIKLTADGKDHQHDYLGGNAITLLKLVGEDLAGKGFANTVLKQANLAYAQLPDTDFSGAELEGANINHADLTKANFIGANLKDIRLDEFAGILCVVFSPDGKYLASGGIDNTVRLWEVDTGQEVRCLKGHTNNVWGVAFSPDGKYLTSGSYDQTVRLWEVESGQEVRCLKGHTSAVWGVAFSPDGKYLASGGSDKTVRLWEVDTGQEVRCFKGYTSTVWGVAFSPDGKYLASGSGDNIVCLWEVQSGQEIRCLEGHTSVVNGVAFSPDGKYLASGSDDKTIRLWEVESGQEVQCFKGDSDRVYGVVFSPDGKYLVSGSSDKTVRLWEVESGQEVRCLKGHTSSVNSVAFSPNGKHIASGSNDASIRIWEVETGKCVRVIEQKLRCKGMNLKGAQGLTKEQLEFFKNQGAVVGLI